MLVQFIQKKIAYELSMIKYIPIFKPSDWILALSLVIVYKFVSTILVKIYWHKGYLFEQGFEA